MRIYQHRPGAGLVQQPVAPALRATALVLAQAGVVAAMATAKHQATR